MIHAYEYSHDFHAHVLIITHPTRLPTLFCPQHPQLLLRTAP